MSFDVDITSREFINNCVAAVAYCMLFVNNPPVAIARFLITWVIINSSPRRDESLGKDCKQAVKAHRCV